MMPLSPHNPNQQMASYNVGLTKNDSKVSSSNYKMMSQRAKMYGQQSSNNVTSTNNTSGSMPEAQRVNSYDRAVLNKTLLPNQTEPINTNNDNRLVKKGQNGTLMQS